MRTYWILISFIFIVSCSKNKTLEKTELNKIVNSVLKYTSTRNSSINNTYLINPALQKLNIYIPSQKEISGEEPGPPPFFSRSIIELLDLKHSQFGERKSDSLNILKQNQYIFDSLKVDYKINTNLKLANKKEIDRRIESYQFSNPVYYNDKFVYIELIYRKSVFGIGFGYLLEKQKDGNWVVKKIVDTFIT
ncbi:hypothetical protein CEY12_11240 [Chryseobacterium sp. T16E-39]|uniref:hypothetical protein n=1 Tax=Chryseobacterium sp. T16E-39 TaxID=2015076 RepID=UPI000B5B4942|nr:hypothetical protein [Chryseobacterium sp. T16E-39]ASK30651.1 hypothetical protein CEY12_11240 [Chryseobacterium sp. T16E-39]